VPREAHEPAQGKLSAARDKLAESKFADVIQKVSDFRTTEALNDAPKPKIDSAHAAALIAGANDVIVCLESLLETTATTQ
jgi:hypothetical protein